MKSLRRQILQKNLSKYRETQEKSEKQDKKEDKQQYHKKEDKKQYHKKQEKQKLDKLKLDKREEKYNKSSEKNKKHEKIISLRKKVHTDISLRKKVHTDKQHKSKPKTQIEINYDDEIRDIFLPQTNLEQDGGASYLSIARSNYKKPRGPTKQDLLTLDKIKAKLKGYTELNSMREKSILQYLQPFRVWIRYYDTKKEKFRVGGLLMKVDYPNYATLVNTKNNISWSIQLNDNIIYIPETAIKMARERSREQQTESKKQEQIEKSQERKDLSTNGTKESTREDLIKEKLYDLFLKGKLKVVL